MAAAMLLLLPPDRDLPTRSGHLLLPLPGPRVRAGPGPAVTIIVDRFLRIRERTALLKKLNMVIGAFLQRGRHEAARSFGEVRSRCGALRETLTVAGTWTDQRFDGAIRELKARRCAWTAPAATWPTQGVPRGPSRVPAGLLENQNLLEHGPLPSFSGGVQPHGRAVLRSDVGTWPRPGLRAYRRGHKRAYVILVAEWLSYLKHLKKEYPYLFSLAVGPTLLIRTHRSR